MTTDAFLDGYFARIGHSGPTEPTLATLAALQGAHARAIPFEGIDRLLGAPIPLDIASLERKLVKSRRGGNCFEHSLVFGEVLRRLGFTYAYLGARVRWMSPPDAPMGPREHAVVMVALPAGDFLVDLGFGARVVDAPIRIDVGVEQDTPAGRFRIGRDGALYALSARLPQGWRTMHAFSLEPQFAADYAMANAYAPLNPHLPFLKNLVAERVADGVRHRLINRRLAIEARDGAIVDERVLADADELEAALDAHFAITPPVPAEALFARAPG